MKSVKKVGIFGIGFMGGSFALVLKDRFPRIRICGYARNKKSYEKIKKLKLTDEVTRKVDKVVRDADIIVLALPVEVNIEYLGRIKPYLKKGCVVFDLGSSKQLIEKEASKIIPSGVFFVGCHPLCGSEKSGAEFSRKDLYRGEMCIITSSPAKAAVKKIKNLWNVLGSKTVFMKAEVHDRILSKVSHLPHAVSFVLTSYVDDRFVKFSAGSFRDLTRISASSASLWAEIFLSNRSNLIKDIEGFRDALGELKSILSKGDKEGLLNFIKKVNLKHKKTL
ncbi:MAG: prephenate dehydrogenase/arogenate dehydrogenase family protein [Candidatus Omnitrophica bacterium]|nr:prephenate dehydrogenase/arogenate dehydrogenase family protein [Candidatus Omnitrophota bacterium]MBD3269786.1 prephenate dehydrogenase/arogenate dehydrogenase family protein [Candidatus Omnitrophota bacterium]